VRYDTWRRLVQVLPGPVANVLRRIRVVQGRRLSNEERAETYDRLWSHINMIDVQYDWLVEGRVLDRAGSLFSIGPGNGALELRLAEKYGLELGYAEPSASSRAALEAAAARAGLGSRITERQAGCYSPTELNRHYDVILSSASWYALGLNREILDRTLALLSEGGALIVELTSRTDFFVARGVRKSIAMTAEDFSEWLTAEGLHHELGFVGRTLPMDLLIRDGEPTRVAMDAIAFFTLSRWDAIPQRERARWGAVLRTVDGDEFTRVRGIVVLRNERVRA